MARRSTTFEIDEGLLGALRRAAGEDGRAEDEVVEEALRRYFGLRGLAVLDEIAEAQASQVGCIALFPAMHGGAGHCRYLLRNCSYARCRAARRGRLRA